MFIFILERFRATYGNKLEKINKEIDKLSYKKVEYQLDLLLKGQEVNREELQLGFIGLAKQNSELFYLNKELNEQLNIVVSELNGLKKEREEKAARRERWSKRKLLPKRDPINSKIYNLLMKESEGPSYIATRTRIAICLPTVTGIRISELLPLKVGQLETLLAEGWISINRLKRGPANHKAFLTLEGKKLVKARKRDFEFLFLMKSRDSYVFISDQKPHKMLRRETITMDVNRVTRSVANCLEAKPNITSHVFM